MPNNSAIIAEAEGVINQYCSALINGDVNTIRKLLGPKLLERHVRVLSNPSYSGKLQEIYRNAVFTVKGYQVIDHETVVVIIEITFNTSEQSKSRFVLKKTGQSRMLILSEDVVPEI